MLDIYGVRAPPSSPRADEGSLSATTHNPRPALLRPRSPCAGRRVGVGQQRALPHEQGERGPACFRHHHRRRAPGACAEASRESSEGHSPHRSAARLGLSQRAAHASPLFSSPPAARRPGRRRRRRDPPRPRVVLREAGGLPARPLPPGRPAGSRCGRGRRLRPSAGGERRGGRRRRAARRNRRQQRGGCGAGAGAVGVTNAAAVAAVRPAGHNHLPEAHHAGCAAASHRAGPAAAEQVGPRSAHSRRRRSARVSGEAERCVSCFLD